MNKLTVILIPFVILLFSFTIVLKDVNFYKKELASNKVAENLNLTEADKGTLENEIADIISYLTGKKDALDSSFFGEQEKIHMQDVKRLVNIFIKITYVLIAIVILLLIFGKERARTLRIAGITSLIVYITAGLIFLNFDYFFVKFHQLVFTNDLWLFPADSPIVKIFPQQFFVDFFEQVLIYSFVAAALITILGFILKKFKKTEEVPS